MPPQNFATLLVARACRKLLAGEAVTSYCLDLAVQQVPNLACNILNFEFENFEMLRKRRISKEKEVAKNGNR